MVNKQFTNVIKGDLKEEVEAKVSYNKLAKRLRKKGLKQAAISVRGIARDEADHHRILRKINTKLSKAK